MKTFVVLPSPYEFPDGVIKSLCCPEVWLFFTVHIQCTVSNMYCTHIKPVSVQLHIPYGRLDHCKVFLSSIGWHQRAVSRLMGQESKKKKKIWTNIWQFSVLFRGAKIWIFEIKAMLGSAGHMVTMDVRFRLFPQIYISSLCILPSPQNRGAINLFHNSLLRIYFLFGTVQFSSVAQSCLALCDPMDRSTPGLPVHHQLLETTQIHVHWVGDTIQPSHPLLSPSPAALSLPQHQGLFQMSQFFTSGGQSIGVSASTSVLPMNTQDWSALGWTGWISLQSKGLSRLFSKTTVQKHQFFGTQLSL